MIGWQMRNQRDKLAGHYMGYAVFTRMILCEELWSRASLEVQEWGLNALTVNGLGSIPGLETKIPQAMLHIKPPTLRKKSYVHL